LEINCGKIRYVRCVCVVRKYSSPFIVVAQERVYYIAGYMRRHHSKKTRQKQN